MRKNHYIVCSIAGSDPMGGAGVQGDLKTLAAHGVEGTAVVTAVTVQSPHGVEEVLPVIGEVVDEQLAVVLRYLRPAVLKTGMLWSAEIARVVAASMEFGRRRPPALVVDPVLRASAGGFLAEENLTPTLRTRLLPLTTVVTPNWTEAAALLESDPIAGPEDAEDAARALLHLGPKAVVLKGGDTTLDPVEDIVATRNGVERLWLPRIPDVSPHGTGCAFASAVAARLAQGASALEAARLAKRYVHRAIAAAVERGTPRRLVHAVDPDAPKE